MSDVDIPDGKHTAALHRKHLLGWLSYAFASEVFVIVSLTLFLPICLEQFARDNGYLLPNKTEPCSSITKASVDGEGRCVVKLGWLWIDSASFSLYVYSISVALQAITVISMGGIADYPPHRKRLLLTFAYTGASAALLFILLPSSSPLWTLSALLAIFANVGFGASVVAMNAYLPTLAKSSPEVVDVLYKLETHDSPYPTPSVSTPLETEPDSPSAPLLSHANENENEHPHAEPLLNLKHDYDTLLSRSTSRISSLGIALGYAAGILLLLLALIPINKLGGSTFALRLAIALSGAWWALFSVPAALWLPSGKSRLGSEPEIESEREVSLREALLDDQGEREQQMIMTGSVSKEIVAAWKRLGKMLRWSEIKKLKNTFRYLAAWFLLSDGFTTITSTAILFGKTTLHMPSSSLILIGVLTPTSGILGSLLWPYLQRKLSLSNLRVLVTLVMLASLIPAYGCLGFLKIFREGNVKFGGLTTEGEMFGLAVCFGIVYGAFQSYARAFYAELIPPGEEARWYGLFSITDKSSSFLGPLIVGLIADLTGNIRYAFFFLVFMIWTAVPILVGVDVERGREDAGRYRVGVGVGR